MFANGKLVCRDLLPCLVKSKRQETSAERQRQSELNLEETTIAKEHSQHQSSTDQRLDNEGNYAELMNRSFSDQQYSSLHIYANSSFNTSANT